MNIELPGYSDQAIILLYHADSRADSFNPWPSLVPKYTGKDKLTTLTLDNEPS
jgi:hypothetical protein